VCTQVYILTPPSPLLSRCQHQLIPHSTRSRDDISRSIRCRSTTVHPLHGLVGISTYETMQKPGILLSFVLAAFINQATADIGFPELAYGYGSQALVAPGLHVAGSAVQSARARGVMSRFKVRMLLEGRQTTPTCETGYQYFPECAADGEGGCCSVQGQCVSLYNQSRLQ